jgi:hypothetical protein
MTLSISQMALMSRLLDEALPLDAAGRRAWLDALPSEYRDIAPALREALLPEGGEAADAAGQACRGLNGSAQVRICVEVSGREIDGIGSLTRCVWADTHRQVLRFGVRRGPGCSGLPLKIASESARSRVQAPRSISASS